MSPRNLSKASVARSASHGCCQLSWQSVQGDKRSCRKFWHWNPVRQGTSLGKWRGACSWTCETIPTRQLSTFATSPFIGSSNRREISRILPSGHAPRHSRNNHVAFHNSTKAFLGEESVLKETKWRTFCFLTKISFEVQGYKSKCLKVTDRQAFNNDRVAPSLTEQNAFLKPLTQVYRLICTALVGII